MTRDEAVALAREWIDEATCHELDGTDAAKLLARAVLEQHDRISILVRRLDGMEDQARECADAINGVIRERDRLRLEIDRLRFYETTSAADAIRMLNETMADRDRLRAALKEALDLAQEFASGLKWPHTERLARIAALRKEFGL